MSLDAIPSQYRQQVPSFTHCSGCQGRLAGSKQASLNTQAWAQAMGSTAAAVQCPACHCSCQESEQQQCSAAPIGTRPLAWPPTGLTYSWLQGTAVQTTASIGVFSVHCCNPGCSKASTSLVSKARLPGLSHAGICLFVLDLNQTYMQHFPNLSSFQAAPSCLAGA